MSKRFEDEEISEIMKEIEALESDFSEDSENNGKSLLEELAEMNPEAAIPLNNSNTISLEAGRKFFKSKMNFEIGEQHELEMNFQLEKNSLVAHINNEGITIQMENGAKFNLSFEGHSIKKAA